MSDQPLPPPPPELQQQQQKQQAHLSGLDFFLEDDLDVADTSRTVPSRRTSDVPQNLNTSLEDPPPNRAEDKVDNANENNNGEWPRLLGGPRWTHASVVIRVEDIVSGTTTTATEHEETAATANRTTTARPGKKLKYSNHDNHPPTNFSTLSTTNTTIPMEEEEKTATIKPTTFPCELLVVLGGTQYLNAAASAAASTTPLRTAPTNSVLILDLENVRNSPEQEQPTRSLDNYQPRRRRQWRWGPDLRQTRSGCATVVCRRFLYAIGGQGGIPGLVDRLLEPRQVLDTVERIPLSALLLCPSQQPNDKATSPCIHLDDDQQVWKCLNTRLSTPRKHCAAVAVDHRYIVVLGGHNGLDHLSSVDIIDTFSRLKELDDSAHDYYDSLTRPSLVASLGPSMWTPRSGLGAVLVPKSGGRYYHSHDHENEVVHDYHEIWVVGGEGVDYRALSTVECLEFHPPRGCGNNTSGNNSKRPSSLPSLSHWRRVPQLTLWSKGRRGHAITCLKKGVIVVAGGLDQRYRPCVPSVELLDVYRKVRYTLPSLSLSSSSCTLSPSRSFWNGNNHWKRNWSSLVAISSLSPQQQEEQQPPFQEKHTTNKNGNNSRGSGSGCLLLLGGYGTTTPRTQHSSPNHNHHSPPTSNMNGQGLDLVESLSFIELSLFGIHARIQELEQQGQQQQKHLVQPSSLTTRMPPIQEQQPDEHNNLQPLQNPNDNTLDGGIGGNIIETQQRPEQIHPAADKVKRLWHSLIFHHLTWNKCHVAAAVAHAVAAGRPPHKPPATDAATEHSRILAAAVAAANGNGTKTFSSRKRRAAWAAEAAAARQTAAAEEQEEEEEEEEEKLESEADSS
ncbi:hypothetical protein ACA910_020083 [Epithemia clementina (nom. ined.)]